MKYYLAKTDPSTYSIDSFQKDKKTIWDGVKNAQAVRALKNMKRGDEVFVYHSQGEGSIRGLAAVTKNMGEDPQDSRSWLVELELIKIYPAETVTLKKIKESGLFPDFSLVKQSRLSTMPVPDSFVIWCKKQGLAI